MAVDAGTVKGTLEFEDKASPVIAGAADEIQSGLDRISEAANSMQMATEDSGAKLTQMGSMAEGVQGALLEMGKALAGAVKDVADMVLESAKAAEVLHNLSLTTGIGVEDLQLFQTAAREAGVGMGAFENAILKMERAIGSNSKALTKWGFDAKQLAALPAAEAFQLVIDKVDQLGDHTTKVAAITDLFGRGAVKSLLPIMDTLDEVAERLRASLGEDQVTALKSVDGAVDALETSWSDLINQFSAAIAANPAIVDGIDAVREAVTLLGVTIKSLDWEAFWAAMGVVMSIFAARLKANFDQTVTTLHVLTAAVKELQHFFAASPKVDPKIFVPDIGQLHDDMTDRLKILDAGLKEEIKNAKDAVKANKEWEKSMADAEKQLTKLSAAAEQGALKEWAADLKQLDALGDQITRGQMDQEKALLKVWEAEEKALEAAQKRVLEENKAGNSYEVQLKAGMKLLKLEEERKNEAAAFSGILSGVAVLADSMGDGFGDLAGTLENITHVSEGWGDSITTSMEKINAIAGIAGQIGGMIGGKAGAAVQGAAGGVQMGAGIGTLIAPGIGTAIGAAVGGITGLFAGIFGDAKKKAAELKKKQDEAMKAFADLFDDWKNARKELAAVGAEGINALVSSMVDEEGNLTEAFTSVANASEYVGATFAMLRASGMSVADALQAMGPALDALSLTDPEALAGTGGAELVQLAQFAQANEQLLNFTTGLGMTANALAGFGMFTQEIATRMSLDMNNAIAQMVAGGLTEAQASALVAQDLYNLKMAAEQSGVTLDAHTQKLIQDAEAAGLFANLEDPMKKLVEVQQAMLAATGELVKLFGGTVPQAVQKMIDEFNNTQINVKVNVTATGGGGGPEPPEDFQHGSGGMQDFGSGTLAMLHGREGVFTEQQIGQMQGSDSGQLSGLIANLPGMMSRAMREAMAMSSTN